MPQTGAGAGADHFPAPCFHRQSEARRWRSRPKNPLLQRSHALAKSASERPSLPKEQHHPNPRQTEASAAADGFNGSSAATPSPENPLHPPGNGGSQPTIAGSSPTKFHKNRIRNIKTHWNNHKQQQQQTKSKKQQSRGSLSPLRHRRTRFSS